MPLTIDPNDVYDDGSLRLALGLTESTLQRARREGSLRFARKGNKTFYVGRNVLAWLGGEDARVPAELGVAAC